MKSKKEKTSSYFANSSMLDDLGVYVNYFDRKVGEDENRRERAFYIKGVISWISEFPQIWDDSCPYFIQTLHQDVEDFVIYTKDESLTLHQIDQNYVLFKKLVYEFLFWKDSEIEELKHKPRENLTEVEKFYLDLSSLDRKQKGHDFKTSLSNLLNFEIGDYGIQLFKFDTQKLGRNHLEQFDKRITTAKAMMADLSNKEKTVVALQTALEKQETGFNFVGLHKGFNQLKVNKTAYHDSCKKNLFWNGIGLGVVPLIAVIGSIFSFWALDESQFGVNPNSIAATFSLISLEVILLYFFRINLQACRRVETELLQIDLRMTLCQFIESYSDYAKKMGGEAMKKFEDIIFSNILPDSAQLPSTFDGMEAINSIIKNIKS